jgi:beta-lactam-binding protein with PASTA domain
MLTGITCNAAVPSDCIPPVSMRFAKRFLLVWPMTALLRSWSVAVALSLACSLIVPTFSGTALAAQSAMRQSEPDLAQEPVQESSQPAPSASAARRVPAVIGMSRDQARTRVRNAGFTPLVSVMPGPAGSTGLVITQRPRAGALLERGRAVAIVVSDTPSDSTPAGPLVMPNVVGAMQSAARSTLASLGTDVIILERRTSIDGEGDRVLAQEPAAGTAVSAGTEVLLTVGRAESLFDSSGARRSVNVPSVVGLSLADARVRLRAAQLGLGEVMPSDSVPPDSVITAQQPDSGARAETGTLIAVSLQRAREPVRRMPWWIALVLFAAAAILGAFLRKPRTVIGPSGGLREPYPSVGSASQDGPTAAALEWPPMQEVSAEFLSLQAPAASPAGAPADPGDEPLADPPPPGGRGAPTSD